MWPTLTLGFVTLVAAFAGCHCLLENRLVADLMKEYNKNVIPTTEDEPVITVEHSISVVKLLKFDHDELRLGTWIAMLWTDKRLKWDPSHYNNITQTHILHEQLWIPDIVTYTFDLPDNKPMMDNLRVVINNNGLVTYVPPTVTNFGCKVAEGAEEIYTCQVKLGSWVYSGEKMDISNSGGVMDLGDMIIDEDWEITNTAAVHQNSRYDCCVELFPNLVYTVELRPKHHRHHCK
ncbi:neuronal acetylcholine receptor subunit alpha-2-like [Pecten maximus]|uniref:neuronal acetylcholine receptor subunit alpha-2-like n=1 Tax=Pecten maximus TaxID=6579 RepID=UPI00145853E1|nr:neuronal acetylcholine receptor subunit alpha-2-like [Pecten maximus]